MLFLLCFIREDQACPPLNLNLHPRELKTLRLLFFSVWIIRNESHKWAKCKQRMTFISSCNTSCLLLSTVLTVYGLPYQNCLSRFLQNVVLLKIRTNIFYVLGQKCQLYIMSDTGDRYNLKTGWHTICYAACVEDWRLVVLALLTLVTLGKLIW